MKSVIDAAQLITAVISLFVAGLAIWYTVKSREDDLSYRELSIRPTLAIYINPNSGIIKLKNIGLGAALIKSIKYKVGDDEIVENTAENKTTDVVLPASIQEMQNKVIRALVNQEYYSQIDNGLPRLDITSFFPYSGHVFPVNTEYKILEVQNIKAVESAVSKTYSRNRFEEWMSSIGLSSRGDFQVSYCSITEKWCGKTKLR